jgi:WD40 repeat protein
MNTVRIFPSSPTDVQPEREAAERVTARLSGIYRVHVALELDRWENRFFEAGAGFQEQIDEMAAFDVVIGILWKRIGSELPPDRFKRADGTAYESGTVYEIETAIEADRRHGRPAVYVFRCDRPFAAPDNRAETVAYEARQRAALEAWWNRLVRDVDQHFLRGFQIFVSTEQFETRLEACLDAWLKEKNFVPSGPVWDIATRGSPYPGLRSYDHYRRDVFFGRQLAIGQARDRLLDAVQRKGGAPVLSVIGSSGSGKSSLVRAGLMPEVIKPGAVPEVDIWRVAVIEPAPDSLALLAARLYADDSSPDAIKALPELSESAQMTPERWARLASDSPEAAADTVAWALNRIAGAEQRRVQTDRPFKACLVLLLDQLESLFGLPGQEELSKLIRALVTTSQVWLVLVMRSDRYPDLLRDKDLLALTNEGATFSLPLPGSAEITDIVRGPARMAGLELEEKGQRSLADELVKAIPGGDALPLLQMTLARLFDGREGQLLTLDAYDAMGRVDGAIAAYADGVVEGLDKSAWAELPILIGTLVRDVARRPDGRIAFTAQVIEEKTFATTEPRRRLLNQLVNAFLLIRGEEGSLRIAHEALLRQWGEGKDSLEAIADRELREARKRARRARWAAAAFLLVALLAGAGGWLAWSNYVKSEQRDSLRLAGESSREIQDGHPLTALLIALEALPGGGPERGLPIPWELRKLTKPVMPQAVKSFIESYQVMREGHDWSVAFSPDGTRLVSGLGLGSYFTEDITLRLWDTASGKEVARLEGHTGLVSSVAFSPDGTRLASGSDDHTIRLWDTASGKEVARLEGHTGPVSPVAFSPDGTRLASGSGFSFSDDTTVRLWDTASGKEVARLEGHTGSISSVAFSPDGTRLASGASGSFTDATTVRLWDTASGKEVARLEGHTGSISPVAFSPDGTRLAWGASGSGFWSSDARFHLWDTASGKEVARLEGHTGSIRSVAFSPDGTRLASGSDDRTIRLWDTASGKEVARLEAYGYGPISSVAFSPDGTRLASGSDDRTIRLWDTASGKEVAQVSSVGFSWDGTRLASGSDDHTIRRLWYTYPSLPNLIRTAKASLPRCLSAEERQRFFLPPIAIVASEPDLSCRD